MPEGDTIHKVAAALAPRLVDAPLTDIQVAARHGPAPPPGRVLRVHARGKHLLLELEGERTLRVHLGMYGSWHRYRRGEAWRKPARRASVVLDTGEELFVCFSAKEVQLLATPGIAARNLRNRLGPDLLDAATDARTAVARARAFNDGATVLADVLLDQRAACGIGNVYKCEVLFIEGVHPLRPLSAMDDAGLARLYRLAADLLGRNLHGGARVTRFEPDGRGRLWVYGRGGAPCLRCDDAHIVRAALGRGRRGTWWCPSCQAD